MSTGKIIEVDHPLLRVLVTKLRDQETENAEFRAAMGAVGIIVFLEAVRHLLTRTVEVDTPLETTTGHELTDQLVIIPVLRAGLQISEGIEVVWPDGEIASIDIKRDHITHQPILKDGELPDLTGKIAIVVDPMLATGGTAAMAITLAKQAGAAETRVVCGFSVPEGIKRVQDEHPEVDIYTATVDRQLDENAYIRPGLGDAGDRGTLEQAVAA